jgi:hypothetical protein
LPSEQLAEERSVWDTTLGLLLSLLAQAIARGG